MILDKEFLKQFSEYDNHEIVIRVDDQECGLKGFIAIHRANNERPAFGATRLWVYNSESEALRDALRLSHTMSKKAALAGLKYGGAKAVLMLNKKNREHREQMLKSYAKNVDDLEGKFITGTDVGLEDRDLKVMLTETPYIVGLPSNPTKYTGLGVIAALKSALQYVFKDESFDNRSFLIQGLGKIGMEIIKHVYESAGEIYVSEISQDRVKEVLGFFPRLKILKPANIFNQKVDVFLPCAVSNAINSENINVLQCRVIVGGANNQLEKENFGKVLQDKNILYAPDYVVNAGGLISVVDEYENENIDDQRVKEKVYKIRTILDKIFMEARLRNQATNIIADHLAKEIIDSYQVSNLLTVPN